MGFFLEPQREKLQEGAVKGSHRKVEVLCCFTTSGDVIPLMLKYEDEEGMRHTVNPIDVISFDQKCYAGVLAKKFDCRAEFYGYMRNFILMFHPDDTTWDLVFPK